MRLSFSLVFQKDNLVNSGVIVTLFNRNDSIDYDAQNEVLNL